MEIIRCFTGLFTTGKKCSEEVMGYEVYTSALADVLCEPSLAMPLTVGMYARWGSGKSFVLRRLQGMNSTSYHTSLQVFWVISSVTFFVSILLSHVKYTGIDYYKYGLLLSFFMDREGVEVHKLQLQKKSQVNIQPS